MRASEAPPTALLALVGAAILALWVPAAAAQDPPHWASASITIDCTSQCHVVHHSTGGNLTQAASNVALCQSCHRPDGLALDLPINTADKAVPGESGVHHAFEACAQNASTGAQPPLDNEMLLRVMSPDALCPEGYVVCSTCHDQHGSDATMGGTPRIAAAKRLTALGSTGTATSGGTFTGTDGFWYLVEIVAGGNETQARFAYSKDNGLTWQDNAGNPCTPLDTASCFRLDQGPVSLGDGVTVEFSAGSYVDGDPGERWEFSASWPFLRAPVDSAGAGSVLCRDCHRAWDMTAVDTWNGGAVKSHPVRVAYPAAGTEGYYTDGPREGDGTAQASGDDGNPSNDLALDGNGHVECLTCHGVHFADSNTLTLDRP